MPAPMRVLIKLCRECNGSHVCLCVRRFLLSFCLQNTGPFIKTRAVQFPPDSGTLAWKLPWTEEPGGLQSMGSHRVRTQLSDFTFTFHFHALEKEMATHSSVLAWRVPGMGEPGGLPSMGSHRVGHD